MAFVPFENCVEVSIKFIWAGQTVYVTLGFCKDGFNEGDVDDLAGILGDSLESDLMDDLSSNIEAVLIRITDLSSDSAPVREYPIALTGAVGSASINLNTAGVISFITDLRGRSYRGRNYIPGIPGTYTSDAGELNGASIIAYLADYANMFEAAAVGGWTHVVLSRFHDHAEREEGVATPVSSLGMDVYLDSQRRRLKGRGD